MQEAPEELDPNLQKKLTWQIFVLKLDVTINYKLSNIFLDHIILLTTEVPKCFVCPFFCKKESSKRTKFTWSKFFLSIQKYLVHFNTMQIKSSQIYIKSISYVILSLHIENRQSF